MRSSPVPRHLDIVNAVSGIGAACALPSTEPRPSPLWLPSKVVRAPACTPTERADPVIPAHIHRSLGISPVATGFKSP